MSSIFQNNRFFPQHFYLESDSGEDVDSQIHMLCREALHLSPESFNGEDAYFHFVLRYCPPYEQNSFRDLKQLQQVARSHVRFKDEFRGYIVIDIAQWQNHFEEELFAEITLAFLSDMSDCWKYIFLSPGKPLKQNELRILQAFFKVKRLAANELLLRQTHEALFKKLGKHYALRLSDEAQELLRESVPAKALQTAQAIIALENDMHAYFGTNVFIDRKMLAAYCGNADSLCCELMQQNDTLQKGD